ncbi:MAG: hypothetical protein K8S87_07040 [Planctomycetes bacterium]|nr:hypothetical protein [Planctomycetota bacterium]
MAIKTSDEYRKFESKIRITGFRVALMSFLYWSLIGIFSASVIVTVNIIVDRIFYPIPISLSISMPILAGIVLGFGLFGIFRKFPTRLSTAIRIDDYLKSDERISSAFLVNDKTNFEQALIYDAMLTLKHANVSGMLKKNFRKISIFTASGIILFIGLFLLLPTIQYFGQQQKKYDSENFHLVDAIRSLSESESEWQRLKENENVLEETNKLLESYEELKDRLQKAEALKKKFHNPQKQKELLSELSSLRDKIEKERKEMAKLAKDVQNMKKQAKNAEKSDNADKSEFEKQTDEFEKNLQEGDFSKASETMKNLLDAIKESDKSEELKQQLMDKLNQLSEQFSNEKMQSLLENMAQNLDGLDLNSLSNQQMLDLMDSLGEFGDLSKLLNNQQLMKMLEDQLKKAQDDMTGG